jgi:hypothetical protein
VIPILLISGGVIALLAGALTLRGFGSRYRVGRLLASTARVSIAEAVAIASGGQRRYVRIDGRIDSEDEFEDAAHRPLVLRRTRLEARRGAWVTFEDSREAVAFEIREGVDAIAVDSSALDDGLIVVRRVSEGVAGDLGDRAPTDMPASTPVRAVVEQVSSIEHAIALGVPVAAEPPEPPVKLTAGLGRPLVLTTLEPAEAMRVLAGGSGRPRIVAACFIGGAALLATGLAWAGLGAVMAAIVPVAMAASPEASAPAGGDPRSAGEGPGLVGQPGIALLAVIGIAVLAIVATTVYIRLTGGPRGGRDSDGRRSAGP